MTGVGVYDNVTSTTQYTFSVKSSGSCGDVTGFAIAVDGSTGVSPGPTSDCRSGLQQAIVFEGRGPFNVRWQHFACFSAVLFLRGLSSVLLFHAVFMCLLCHTTRLQATVLGRVPFSGLCNSAVVGDGVNVLVSAPPGGCLYAVFGTKCCAGGTMQ